MPLSAFALLLVAIAATAPVLETPTRELRQEALAAFAQGDRGEAQENLLDAQELARGQKDPYVKANELRYVADAWARTGHPEQAADAFAESMEAASAIPTWNHRLYASIGVVEMQRATGDMDGTRRNGMKALDSGLLEAVAASGGAAEMGRFFTALDGVLTQAEREELKQRIAHIGNAKFQRKALHALEGITVKQEF